MSVKCRKCGAVLKETNVIVSIKAGSDAEAKGVSAGEKIVAVDGQSVKTKDDIVSLVRDKEACKINILYKDNTRTVSVDNVKEFIKGIEFSDEEVCSNCGAKQKKSLFIPILVLGIVLLSLGICLFVVLRLKTGDSDDNENITQITEYIEKSDTSDSIFSDEFEKMLEAELKETEYDLQDKDSNDIKKDPELNSEYIIYKDGNPETTQNKKGRGRKGRGENSSSQKAEISSEKTVATPPLKQPDIPSDWTVKLACRIYFKYGSSENYLNKIEGSIETLFNGISTTDKSSSQEFTNIIKTLEWLIQQIDENKRSEVKFYVDGFADSTFRDGIPTDSEDSQRYNTSLSKDRADTVKSLLTRKEFNVSEDNIIVTPHGYNIEEEKEYELWTFRRVDIFVSYKD